MASSPPRHTLGSVIVGVAFFMHGLDSTIITTAVPQIAQSFGVSPVQLGSAVIAYLLSLAVFVPVAGWLADRFGAAHTFAAAIAVFTTGSLFCGFSENVLTLTASRIVEGAGAALMFPVGRLVVFHNIPKSAYIRAMVIVGMFPTLGMMMGPPVGGFIATYMSWRWIFFINIPIGLAGIVLVLLYVENFRAEERRALDWTGFILTAVALSAVLYGLEGLGRGGGDLHVLLPLLGFGLVVGIFAVRHARRAPNSLIDLTLLRIATLRINITAGSLFRVTAGSLPFLLPLLFQVAFGKTAFESGMLTIAIGGGLLSMRLFVERLLKDHGFRRGLVAVSILSAVCLTLCALLTPDTPAFLVIALLGLQGFIQGFQYTALNTLSLSEVPQSRMSAATSFSQMFQQLSHAMGVAFSASLLNLGMLLRGEDTLARSDFYLAFAGLVVLNLIVLAFYARIPPEAGENMRKR